MARWPGLTVVSVLLLAPRPAPAADLSVAAVEAFDEYFAAAREAFVAAARADGPALDLERDHDRALRGVVQPGAADGILSRPDSLVHHWRGEIFIPGVTLDEVIAVSQAYADYPRIFKPIRAARILPPTGDAFNVLFRMRASAGGLTATLDLRTRIEWVRVNERRVYSVSSSQDIREVKNAGQPTERLLPEGHDSGYLWRAATMTRFLARDDGVWMAMETVGLSRRFPMLLGWLIEPIARRVGRGSVENSMQEFAQGVLTSSKLAR